MRYTRLRVQELARGKGLNITTFGRRAELAQGSARDWWYGTVNKFDGDVLERIARALDVTVPDLFETIPEEKRAESDQQISKS